MHRLDDPYAPDPVLTCWFYSPAYGKKVRWNWDDDVKARRSPRFNQDGTPHCAWNEVLFWSPNSEDQKPAEPPLS